MNYEVNPLVSVIIPCYNYAHYLPDAVNSVISQTYTNWEIIIINDGSTDNTEEISIELTKRDNRIRYYKQKNSGVIQARNYAISLSRGKYILPLDGDDKISNTYLEKAVDILENNNQIRIVYGLVEFFDKKTGLWNLPKYSLIDILHENMIVNCALFYKDDFTKVNGFNKNMGQGFEDWDFWLSMIENGCGIYRMPEVTLYYRMHGESRSKSAGINEKKLRKEIMMNHLNLYMKGYEELWSRYSSLTDSKYVKIALWIKNALSRFKIRRT